jgi:hypothetical protein
MVPMIDTAMVPGLATMVISVGPAMVGVGLALIAGVAWIARGTAEELRRQAARDYDARAIRLAANRVERIAA